jgi:nitric oxide reductase large subunit
MVASFQHGFWFARSYEFIHSTAFQTFTWLRMFGDLTFVIGGVLPLVFVIVRGMFYLRPCCSGDAMRLQTECRRS